MRRITVKNEETWIGWLQYLGPYPDYSSFTGQVSLWKVNPDLSRGPYQQYGPFGSWRLTSIGAADDGSARLLWRQISHRPGTTSASCCRRR